MEQEIAMDARRRELERRERARTEFREKQNRDRAIASF